MEWRRSWKSRINRFSSIEQEDKNGISTIPTTGMGVEFHLKKTAIFFLVLFIAGLGIYYSIPKNVVTVTSGEIALRDKRALVDDADVILRGTVSEVKPSFWSNPNGEKGKDVRNIIQTDIVVNVAEIYKGESYNKESVTVRIEGYPDFEHGEEMILFLSKDDGD